MNEPRLIARMTLLYLADLTGIPQTRDDIARYITRRTSEPCRPQVGEALRRLTTLGYIENGAQTADDEPLYKITASGLRQAERQVAAADLDPFVWGD